MLLFAIEMTRNFYAEHIFILSSHLKLTTIALPALVKPDLPVATPGSSPPSTPGRLRGSFFTTQIYEGYYVPALNSSATAARETEPYFRTSSSTLNLELWFGAVQPFDGLFVPR